MTGRKLTEIFEKELWHLVETLLDILENAQKETRRVCAIDRKLRHIAWDKKQYTTVSLLQTVHTKLIQEAFKFWGEDDEHVDLEKKDANEFKIIFSKAVGIKFCLVDNVTQISLA